MPHATLFPIIASGGIVAYRAATKVVSEGLSFASQLVNPTAGDVVAEVPAASAEPTPPSDALQKKLDDLASQLTELLTRGGIDSTQPVEFSLDGIGGVDVEFDHSQASEIEQLLADQPELLAKIHEIAEQIIAETAIGTAAPRDVRLTLSNKKLAGLIDP